MSNYLSITHDDVRRKRNPGNDPNLFQIGTGIGQCDPETLDEKIGDWDEYVVSRMPEKYNRWSTRMFGEVIAEVDDSQSTATLGLLPVTEGSVVLYKNYFSHGRDYCLRRLCDRMDRSLYSVDYETGIITFDPPLSRGDVIVADYRHSALSKCRVLRKIAIGLIVADLMADYPQMGDTSSKVDEERKQAYLDIDRIRNNTAFLKLFDDLHTVDEYATRNADSRIEFSQSGGFF